MMRKALLLVLGLACAAVLYYSLARPFEFSVTMTARTVPGDVIETIRLWNRSLPDAAVVDVDSFSTLTQNIVWNGRKYVYHWRFNMADDSSTNIKVEISQPGRRFRNKLLVPFTEQRIEQDAAEVGRQFYDVLKTHLSITRVAIAGEAALDSSFCVCRSLTTPQVDKARGMMKDYALLTSFIDQYELEPDGPPLVKVRKWNHSTGQLKFDFCFPVVLPDSLPDTRAVSYQYFRRQHTLKAVYHGNYITSDRAWYALIDYAHRKGYEIDGFPIEYFHNNPNMGLNESEWRADVYLPIADQDR